jgi:uncharacterized protein
MLRRSDYAFPFRIDPVSRQGARAAYEAHVEQMIRQVLLTSPGERVNLPQFGCGLRQVLFAPYSEALTATVKIQISRALDTWLANHITVKNIIVSSPDDAPGEGQVYVQIEYVLLEWQTVKTIDVLVF